MFRDMTPQPYPLACSLVQGVGYYLVLGWTPDGLPVVVKQSGVLDREPTKPEVLTKPVKYALPEHDVTISSSVRLDSDSSITATVSKA